MYQMHLHGVAPAFDVVLAGRVEMELFEFELTPVHLEHTAKEVVHLDGVTVVEHCSSSGGSSASMNPLRSTGDWFLPLAQLLLGRAQLPPAIRALLFAHVTPVQGMSCLRAAAAISNMPPRIPHLFMQHLIRFWKVVVSAITRLVTQASLRSRERFWDIRVPKIDSIFDNSLVPRTS